MYFSDLFNAYHKFIEGQTCYEMPYIESVALVTIKGVKNLKYTIRTFKEDFNIFQKCDEDFNICLIKNADLLKSKGFEDDLLYGYEEVKKCEDEDEDEDDFEEDEGAEDTGLRYNKGKPMMELIEPGFMEEVAKILTFGAEKYEIDNWKKFDKIKRFQAYGSLMRHLEAHRKGEKTDPESGCSHLCHIVTNAMFLWWFDNNPIDK